MAHYKFKLLQASDEGAERLIDVPFEATLDQVKAKVREAYRIPPTIQLEFLVNGDTLEARTKWGNLPIRPQRDLVMVIGTRPE
jgi:hypothetical protein